MHKAVTPEFVPGTRKRGRKGLLAVVVGFATILTACAGSSSSTGSGNTASAPGITETTITLGSHQPLTGPAAPGYARISLSSNAFFQWINDHGGVNGRTIVYKFEDDGYNPTRTTTVVRKAVLEDKVFALFDGLGTPTHLAVVDYLNTEKVPDVFVASGCNCWGDASKYPYTYGWQPDYTIEGKILGQYITQNFADQKVGYFYQNDEFGQDGVKGLDLSIPGGLVGSGARQTYVTSNPDVAPAIDAIQASGAKVVVLYAIPAFAVLAMSAAAKRGYHPQWVISSVGSDPTTLKGILGAKLPDPKPFLEGIVSDTYLAPLTKADDPWVQLFEQVRKKYIPTIPMDGNVEYGMAVAYSFVEAMKKAGQNPTRQDLINVLNGGKLSQGAGLTKFGYSSSSHLGYLGQQMFTIKSGDAVVAGPVYQATDTGPITTYTGGEIAPPTNGVPQ